MQLCLDAARLNKALIRPVHRWLLLNYILTRLAGVKYLTLIDVSSGYNNLKLDKQSSYLTAFFLSIWQVPTHMIVIWSSIIAWHGQKDR